MPAEEGKVESKKRQLSDEESEGEKQPLEVLDAVGSGVAMTEEERKLEEKRAYNRKNAARARKRVKDQLRELCCRVETFSEKNEALQQSNDDLTNRVTALTEENMLLRRLILEKQVSGVPSIPTATSGSSMSLVQGPNQQPNFPFPFNPMY